MDRYKDLVEQNDHFFSLADDNLRYHHEKHIDFNNELNVVKEFPCQPECFLTYLQQQLSQSLQ